jgi:23S rRNA (pseudouridine1915-N3)-methyltransferase
MALSIHLLAVGKIKERGLREVIDDYAKRIIRYAQFRELEIKDGNEAEVEARFRKAIPARAQVVALEVEGRALTSEAMARWVGAVEDSPINQLVFMIGGAYGLPRALSHEANLKLSLSSMIFPHRIARVVLIEQIYRSFTILRGEPYSHA